MTQILERSSPARNTAYASIVVQARKTAIFTIKGRARDYLSMPWQLDMIKPGFDASFFTPGQLIEFSKEVLRQEVSASRRFSLVPVTEINAKAAILAGRHARAKAHHSIWREA